jgi:hypothetical protein
MLWLAVAFQIALLGSASGQTPPSESNDEEVIVHPPDEHSIQAIVRDITSTPTSYWQAPLWHNSVCFRAVGLREQATNTLLERMRGNVRDLGLRISGPHCDENVLIIVTDDVSAAVNAADQRRLHTMAIDRDHGVSMGPGAWHEFVTTTRPVRWWHVSELVTSDNEPAEQAGRLARNDSAGGAIGGTTVRDTGYIHRPTHLNLHHVLIVVDASQVNGVPLTSLADYLTMISLAPINPDADVASVPSILALFSETHVGELTDWDRAYLRGLYAANPNALHSAQQERDIAHRMRQN